MQNCMCCAQAQSCKILKQLTSLRASENSRVFKDLYHHGYIHNLCTISSFLTAAGSTFKTYNKRVMSTFQGRDFSTAKAAVPLRFGPSKNVMPCSHSGLCVPPTLAQRYITVFSPFSLVPCFCHYSI